MSRRTSQVSRRFGGSAQACDLTGPAILTILVNPEAVGKRHASPRTRGRQGLTA